MATSVIDEKFLPARLTAPPMTDEDFAALCAQYPNHQLEVTAEGDLLIMAPASIDSSEQNSEITTQLRLWTRKTRLGFCTDSSGGFVLPNGARRSPDASWTSKERLKSLGPDAKRSFLHLAPDFVIELRSSTDRLPALRRKMHEWIDNGSQLAWLIDPLRRTVEIYRPRQAPEILVDPKFVSGDGPVRGFKLVLRPVWNPS